jgi:MYXO-CTERM domain-containing protein
VPHPESCNRIDDDCNGTTDDMPDLVCGVGPCLRTAVACTDGVAGVCTPGAPTMETCNGIDDDCDTVIDDGLMGCRSPDANLLGDAAVLPDAATSPDASSSFDGGMGRDAGPCHDWWCDPNRLNGRAGPGCSCDVSGAHAGDRGALALALGVIALVVRRRRARTSA